MKLLPSIRLTAVAALLGLGALSAQATVWRWYTTLDEFQAGQLNAGTSNPNDVAGLPASSGTGSGSGTYDDVEHLLTWSFTVSGLSAPATLAHFHFGAPGAFRGPVRIETPSLEIGPPSGDLLGNTGGSFSGSQDFDDPFTPGLPAGGVAQLQSELLAGNWYINIHTRNFGAGEIRGQILIPEPGSVALLGAGLLALAGWRRRRA